jgi:hypothetical protein
MIDDIRNEEIRRNKEYFITWASRFTPMLTELYRHGFKGYIIKHDGNN